MDSSRGQAEACPRCGRPAAAGHACGKRALQQAAGRRAGDTQDRLGSSPTLGAGGGDAGEPPRAYAAAVQERTPPPRATLIGKNLGSNYRVVEPIGAGGMGVVYLVEHITLKKRFAAKVLNSDLAAHAEARARFEDEAPAVTQREQDNIINVIDYGATEDDLVFLVMEYLKGRTLQARMDQAPLSRDELLGVMLQVCHAHGCAHEAGIVHRDMKPDNIFLNERMRGRPPLVKVLDFGISKARDVSLKDGRITKQGQVLGSPEYMSPEAARGDEVDGRADIYAVGIILYELVTGSVPFRSENYLKVLQKHISEKPVPPRQLVPDLPEAMERLILRTLAKHPDGRQQTMEELEQDLLEAMPEEALRVLNPRRTPSGGGWLHTPPIGVPATPRPSPPGLEAAVPPAPVEAPPAEEAPPVVVASVAPSRTKWAIVAGVAAAILLLGFVVLRGGGAPGEDKEKPAATPTPAPTPMPAPAPTEAIPPTPTPELPAAPAPTPPAAPAPTASNKISFRVDSTPRGAAVTLNGKAIGKTPVTIQVPRSRKPGQLRIALQGHQPVARKVDLSRPVDMNIALARAAPSKPDAGAKDLELRQNR
jgi:serine/threonine-protein kinase